ncbi:MAG: hypothetical protein PHP86_09295 [Nevskiales bacterium]|nr:hypothetical protein [Nevskiales bacterium]
MRVLTPVLMAKSCAVVALCAAVCAPASAGIQCWTDENGHRACGDHVPPQYAKKETRVYDEGGRVIEVRERQRTEAELAAERRRAEEAEAERKRAQEQAAYDQFLLTTFNNVGELEATRDERVATLDGRLALAEKSLADNVTGIRQLREQIAESEKTGQPAPERLRKKLANFEARLAQNQNAVDKLKQERVGIISRFERDIERYRSLTGATP